MLEALNEVLRFAAANGGGADDESAVRNGFGETLELFGAGEKRRGAHGRACFAKSQVIWSDYAKMEEAEVAHGAGGGANVERIARVDEDDAEVIELGLGGQGTDSILRRGREKGEYNSDEQWQNERRWRGAVGGEAAVEEKERWACGHERDAVMVLGDLA